MLHWDLGAGESQQEPVLPGGWAPAALPGELGAEGSCGGSPALPPTAAIPLHPLPHTPPLHPSSLLSVSEATSLSTRPHRQQVLLRILCPQHSGSSCSRSPTVHRGGRFSLINDQKRVKVKRTKQRASSSKRQSRCGGPFPGSQSREGCYCSQLSACAAGGPGAAPTAPQSRLPAVGTKAGPACSLLRWELRKNTPD